MVDMHSFAKVDGVVNDRVSELLVGFSGGVLAGDAAVGNDEMFKF